MKILILLLYYDRPLMVRNALRSLAKSDYKNWELAFIDDSSPRPGKPIVEEILAADLDKVKFYHTGLTLDEKRRIKGSLVGKTMNQVIAESAADLAIMLCDDDALCPTYLAGLDEFFTERPETICCYSHVYIYNPAFEHFEWVNNLDSPFNKHTGPINPYCQLDASQMAWRTTLHQRGVWFPWPQTKWLDAAFYQQIGALFPEGIPFSGMVGQYKGVHVARLVNHDQESAWEQSFDIPEARRATSRECIYSIIWGYGRRGLYAEAKRICQLALEVYPDDELLLNSLKFNEGG